MDMRRRQQSAQPQGWRHVPMPVRRLTQLRGMPVVDLSSASRVGYVTNVLLDPNSGSIQALDVSSEEGDLMRVKGIDVRRIGQHAVVLLPGTDRVSNHVCPVEDWIDISDLIGLEVLSDTGDRVGFISEAYIAPETLEVDAYELDTPQWQVWLKGPRTIAPESVILCSAEVMIVPAPGRARSTWVDDNFGSDQSASDWSRPVALDDGQLDDTEVQHRRTA